MYTKAGAEEITSSLSNARMPGTGSKNPERLSLGRAMACLALVAGAVLGTTGFAESLVEDEDDGPAMDATIYLDAHAHIGSCAAFQAADSTAQCTGQVVSSEDCGLSSGLSTTADDYNAAYASVSGSQRTQVLSMAYKWSSPLIGVSDDYAASQTEIDNVQCENNYVVQQAAETGGTLLPFCSVNPKKDYAVSEIGRCADIGVAGLKMHFSSSEVDVRDGTTAELVTMALQAAQLRGLPVVIHFGDLQTLCGACSGDDPEDKQGMIDAMTVMLKEILPATPGLHLTFAHLTGVGSFPDWTQQTFQMLIDAYQPGGVLREADLDLYVDVAAVFDTTASVCNQDRTACQIPGVTSDDLTVMENLLEQWGYDRVLWGSDLNTETFDDTVSLWPGTPEEFNEMADADGADFRDTQ